jgi:hypothetical protein
MVREAVQLACSDDQLDSLHLAIEHSRASSETVRVNREALANLLLDHGRIAKALGEAGYTMKEPK